MEGAEVAGGTAGPARDQGELTLPGLVRERARQAPRPRVRPASRPAAILPVAQVLVDVPLAHLDRPFDYQVPDTMADDAVPGARVTVRFAGRDVDGFVLERVEESEHPGRLAPLRRVVSPEPVLAPEVADLTAEIANRWAGTRSDVLRLAVPPRHATVEKREIAPAPPVRSPTGPGPGRRTTGERPCSAGSAPRPDHRAGRSFRCCRATTASTCWPALRCTRPPRARGCWCACPTTATSTGSTRH